MVSIGSKYSKLNIYLNKKAEFFDTLAFSYYWISDLGANNAVFKLIYFYWIKIHMDILKRSEKSWLHSMHVLFSSASNWRLSLFSMKPRIYVSNLKRFFFLLIYIQCTTDLIAIITLHSNWTICFSFSVIFFFVFLFIRTRCTQRKLFTVKLASASVGQPNRNDWKCVCIKKFKTSIKSTKPKRNFVFLLFTLKISTAVDTYTSFYVHVRRISECVVSYTQEARNKNGN